MKKENIVRAPEVPAAYGQLIRHSSTSCARWNDVSGLGEPDEGFQAKHLRREDTTSEGRQAVVDASFIDPGGCS
jgi:hypothetical protein